MKEYCHIDKTTEALKRWYVEKTRHNQIQRMSFSEFHSWYINNAHACHYCGLTVHDSQKIVRMGLLKSNRFPQNGILGRGTSRGMWMEIDRYNPKGNYEIQNIVPACYFCNNDKSDVFNGDQYKQFLKDRSGFLRSLIQ